MCGIYLRIYGIPNLCTCTSLNDSTYIMFSSYIEKRIDSKVNLNNKLICF